MTSEVINTEISLGNSQYFIDTIFKKLIQQKPSYVCFVNVHSLMLSYTNSEFNKILNNSDLVAPDGRGITIYLRLVKKIKQDRIAGMDLMPKLLNEANKRSSSVYLYGSTMDTLTKVKQKIKKEYPNVIFAGMYSPPFRELTKQEQLTINKKINSVGPDLLFVSLGCPKQEIWMSSQKGNINSCMLGLGQAFKTFSGEEKRLHPILRNFKWLPLEWLYRLYLEPKRLWKRYLWSNSLFIWVVLKLSLKKKI